MSVDCFCLGILNLNILTSLYLHQILFLLYPLLSVHHVHVAKSYTNHPSKINTQCNTGECVQMGKDRDGCPKIVNLGSTKTDLFYERKKYGFKKR